MITNIHELKGASIVAIIEAYIPLRKNGVNHIACCPFHNERSPSFVVSEEKGIYKCFGCGKGGDAINFIQEYEKIDFNQALQRLSELANITLEYDTATPSPKHPSTTLEQINTLAKKQLQKSPELITYLANRGITQDMCEKYDIGLIPSLQELLAHCSKNELVESNFANVTSKPPQNPSSISIPMHHRISIAIRNPQHKIIAFVARTHPHYPFKPNAPKYINSKDSYFYKKTHTLYLYSNAKREIQATKQAYIVEGYIDCQLLHENGYKNACATGGTAFNIAHLNLLIKLDCEVIFCFDNDKSGMEANMRALQVCFNAGFYNAKIALLQNRTPKGSLCKDINEAILTHTPLAFKILSGFTFYTKMLYKKLEAHKAFEQLKDAINKCQNYYHKQDFIKHASRATQIPSEYFTTHTPLPKSQAPSYHKLIGSILHSSDCAYIASELDFSFLPRELYASVQDYLHAGTTHQNLAPYLSAQPLESEDFYLHYCDCFITHLQQILAQAKATRDLWLLTATAQKIAEVKSNIASTKAF